METNELNLAQLESRLKELEKGFNQLEPGERIKLVEDLSQVHASLQVSNIPEELLVRFERLRHKYDRLATLVTDWLMESCRQQLHQYRGDLPIANVSEFEQDLRTLQQRLTQVVTLLPGLSAQSEFQELQTRYESLERKLINTRALQDLKDELKQIWKRAEELELEENYATGAITRAKDALDLITAAIRSRNWDRDQQEALLGLRKKAEERHDDLRRRHDLPVTRLEGDELVLLIIDFYERTQRNPSVSVTYFANEEVGAPSKVMPVSESLDIARKRLLGFWRGKIEEYIAGARAHLNDYQPDKAMSALESWQALPGLYDERVGFKGLPTDLQNIINPAAAEIEPQLQAWTTARTAVEQANLKTDPLEAYACWQRAETAYTHLPGLKELRQAILKHAGEELARLLPEAEAELKKEHWGNCVSRMERCEKLVALDVTLQTQYQDQYTSLHSVFGDVRPVTVYGAAELRGEAAREVLENLQRTYTGQYWEGWQGLQVRLAELEARREVVELIQEVNKYCEAEAVLDTLERLKRDGRAMLDHPPANISQHRRRELQRAIEKLTAWMGFVQARDELSNLAASESDDSDAPLELIAVPDLRVIRNGIQAAKQHPEAAAALRDRRFETELARLERNDAQVGPVLERVRAVLVSPASSITQLQVAHKQLRQWLARPTSYRVELLGRQEELQAMLFQQVEQEIKRLIAEAQPWYESLDVAQLDKLLAEYVSLPSYTRIAEEGDWASQARQALAVARAHQLERAAPSYFSWTGVQREWETAASYTRENDPLHTYCLHRARQAYKESEFERALVTQEAENILRALCQDPILRNDWEVWFQYGSWWLEKVQTWLRAGQLDSSGFSFNNDFTKARTSLGRAEALATGTAIVVQKASKRQRLLILLVELDQWERAAGAEIAIQAEIPTRNGRPTFAKCQQVLTLFDTVLQSLNAGEPRQLLERFWLKQRDEARRVLEEQFEQSQDVFEKVDALRAIHLLFPEEEMAERRFGALLDDGVRKTAREVEEIVFDDAAGKFLARYRKKHRNKPPESEVILELQIQEAQNLADNIATLKEALQIKKVASTDELMAALDEEEERLQRWLDQLTPFRDSLATALNLAQQGLRAPQKFAESNYVLRQGDAHHHETLGDTPQVAENFTNKGHPTVGSYRRQVQQLQRRRQKQEQLRAEIATLLQEETNTARQVGVLLEPGQNVPDDELALFEELPRQLEKVREKIREMRTQDPNDSCGLQWDLPYQSPEENDNCYQSLGVVDGVIEHKLRQYYWLRQWLEQFRVGPQSSAGDCPGIVDWPSAKTEIEKLRDSGPQGLVLGLAFCQEVREGQKAAVYHGNWAADDEVPVSAEWHPSGTNAGLWSLRRAYHALNFEVMAAQWREAVGSKDGGSEEEGFVLYVVSAGQNQRRVALQRQFAQQLKDANEIEADMRWRNREYNNRWDAFLNAYDGVLSKKGWRPIKWHETEEWQRFYEAAHKFCQICPDYPEFVAAMETVEKMTRLPSGCGEKENE